MYTNFSLALLASAAMARTPVQGALEAAFQGYAASFNKHYSTTAELEQRMQTWIQNGATVQWLNQNNSGNGVTFAMNATGDLTTAEFKMMQGLVVPDEDDNGGSRRLSGRGGNSNNGTNGGGLQEDLSVNWVTKGKVHAVKSQGGCGSCWAFAATTVQEAMQAIKNDAAPVRLSEQEGVDCDASSFGCQGGWMSNYWRMSADIGSQSNADYEYEAQDGACRHQQGKAIASRAKESAIELVGPAVADIKAKLQDGPLSIAVAAGNECWRYYESGILSAANNCPTNLDHGVVIVGLVEAGEQPHWIVQNSWGTGWGEQGFVRIAVEEGDGTSAMNTHVEAMNVEDGYPDEDDEDEGEDDTNPEPDMCLIDEDFNEMGPGRCDNDSECRGDRVCCQEYNYCLGESNCPEDEDDEGEEDQCMIDETLNPLGPHQCSHAGECKGDRHCSEFGWCLGESNCEDDEVQPTPEELCMIDEFMNINGAHTCSSDNECRGERTCGTTGMCTGYCNCP